MSTQTSRRRSLIVPAALATLIMLIASTAGAATPIIAIIKSSTLPPFEQATQAIVTALRSDPLQPEILTFDLAGEDRNGLEVLGHVHEAHASLVITVGSLATAAATAHATEPVVFSMVLYPQQSGFKSTATREVTGASLDIPVEVQFRYLRRLLPTAKRVGVLFDPAETGSVIEAAQEAARKHGFTLVGKPIDDSTSPVDALEALVHDVDLVWAVADSHVFTPQTTSALVLATLRHHVPLIGLSTAHVRAGALAALYCNYDDVGKQTAEAALRVLHGESAKDIPIATPRAVGLALNLHTAEHLGVQVAPELQTEAGEVVR